MTTINCSSDCIYQKDGKCNLDRTTCQSFSSNNKCAYFKAKLTKTGEK